MNKTIEYPYLKSSSDIDWSKIRYYSVPKVLFENKYYSKLSLHARMLYGILLDRTSLSIKNNWIDETGVFVRYTEENLAELMNIRNRKSISKYKNELSEFGLIHIVKTSRENIIYVKNFDVDDVNYCPLIDHLSHRNHKDRITEHVQNSDTIESNIDSSEKRLYIILHNINYKELDEKYSALNHSDIIHAIREAVINVIERKQNIFTKRGVIDNEYAASIYCKLSVKMVESVITRLLNQPSIDNLVPYVMTSLFNEALSAENSKVSSDNTSKDDSKLNIQSKTDPKESGTESDDFATLPDRPFTKEEILDKMLGK